MPDKPHFASLFVTSPQQLAAELDLPLASLEAVHRVFPLRISRYYLQLIKQFGMPLWRQAVPDMREIEDQTGREDPLAEDDLSPVPGLVHKYPDRALFLVSNQCATYCRFCTRKRLVGRAEMVITDATIAAGLAYLRRTPAISDVLLSGGDPFMLSDQRIESILTQLRAIPSITIIRIGSRIPCTLPNRITPDLVAILKRFHPLYINTHFNHPAEITPEAAQACERLADAGIPLGCQTVLLRGVNDDSKTIRQLMCALLAIRVKPYALYQADLTRGTSHFRTSIDTGLAIMHQLIGHTSGMAVPTYSLDAPGGGGKIPLTPTYVQRLDATLDFCDYLGINRSYPNTIDP